MLPERQLAPCAIDTVEDFLAMRLFPNADFITFDQSVLPRLARLDVVIRRGCLLGYPTTFKSIDPASFNNISPTLEDNVRSKIFIKRTERVQRHFLPPRAVIS